MTGIAYRVSFAGKEFVMRKKQWTILVIALVAIVAASAGLKGYQKKQDQKDRVPKDKLLIFYCDRGGASMQAARSLARQGCRTRSVIGGFAAYRGRNLVRG